MKMRKRQHRIIKIISGGQTGADRGALDAAISMRLPHGGWCPKGRLAEDGVIPSRYGLTETASAQYRVRTEQNVIDSDGTLIIYRGILQGGSELTRRMAVKYAKPHLLVDVLRPLEPSVIRQWIESENIAVLNVAGPRESSAPGIGEQVRILIRRILSAGQRTPKHDK